MRSLLSSLLAVAVYVQGVAWASPTTECEAAGGNMSSICEGGDGTVNQYWYPDEDGDGKTDSVPCCCGDFDYCGPTWDGWGFDYHSGGDKPVGTWYSTNSNDCDDTNKYAYSTSTPETCDLQDNDCDGFVDESATGGKLGNTWYYDNDNDGYGNDTVTKVDCSAVSPGIPWVSPHGDCDDNEPLVYPNAEETCDGVDTDCDGVSPYYSLTYESTGRYKGTIEEYSYFTDAFEPYVVYSLSYSECDAWDPAIYASLYRYSCDPSTPTYRAVEGLDLNRMGESDLDRDGYIACGGPVSPMLDTSLVGGGDCLEAGDLAGFTGPGIAIRDSTTDCMTDEDEDEYGADFAQIPRDDDGAPLVGTATADRVVSYDHDNPPDGLDAGDVGPGDLWTSIWTGGSDCDDTYATGIYVSPTKIEACDGLDNDCSRTKDAGGEELTSGLPEDEKDLDGDGYVECSYTATMWYGDEDAALHSVDHYTVPVTGGLDCNEDHDETPTSDKNFAGVIVKPGDIHPGAVEICNGVDDDCDGAIDEGLTQYAYYRDSDGDGYGDPSKVSNSCLGTYTEYVTTTDSTSSTTTTVTYKTVRDNSDCDDAVASVHPGAPEMCNSRDDNCKDGLDDGLDTHKWYLDEDGDHVGSGDPVFKCNDPDDSTDSAYVEDKAPDYTGDWVVSGGDCNDADDNVYPDHTDWDGSAAVDVSNAETGEADCNLVDDNCDGSVDEGIQTTYYYDADADGFGTSATQQLACKANKPGGFVQKPDDPADADCNDSDYTVFPFPSEGFELCDGQRNDCKQVAYGVPADEVDTDGDNYVECDNTSITWKGPATIQVGADCAPEDPYSYPFAAELCDGITNDCYQRDDVEEPESNLPADEVDDDGDFYVDCDASARTWSELADRTIQFGTDCDDSDELVYPEAAELCDGQRNDCDFYTDGVPTDEVDTDGDTFVECGYTGAEEWSGDTPSEGLDCDPDDANRYPGAYEVCDGVWDDCNAAVADGGANPAPDDEQDLDGDKYVGCGYDPSAYAWASGVAPREGIDCGQTDATVYPGAYEECDGQFNDCDDGSYVAGLAPDVELDDDGDGWVECELLVSVTWVGEANVEDTLIALPDGGYGNVDCDDDDEFAFPGAAPEDDPNGCLRDADGDFYGDASAVDPVSPGTDCDDDNGAVYPGASEFCEPDLDAQVDNDCDGNINTQEGVPTSYGEQDAYPDADGDSFGTDDGRHYRICVLVDGYSRSDTDCDDAREDIHPGADEYCNGADEDCDAVIDEADDLAPEGAGCLDGYRDVDGDGFGDVENHMCLCMDGVTADYRGDAYVLDSTDCYDYDANIAPGNGVDYSEICDNGVDDDADGVVDSDDDDCQMVLSDGSPGELCGDGTDNDGDGDIDVDDADCPRAGQRVRTQTEWLDGDDNDCDGYVPVVELDCDDDGSLPLVGGGNKVERASDIALQACVPSAPGSADASLSLNCLGMTDIEATCNVTTKLWEVRYTQSDDGFGGRFDGGRRVWPDGRVCTTAGDCDDHCASRCPDLDEVCDGIDNNCSDVELPADIDGVPASLDEGISLSGTVPSSEVDIDRDGYLSCGSGVGPDGIHRVSGSCADIWEDPESLSDCDNTCTLSSPVAVERCDGAVGLCGGPAEGVDDDGDGLSTCGAWSADDSLSEDVYLLVHVTLRDADVEDLDTATAETGSALPRGLLSPTKEVLPLLLPRKLSVDCDADLAVALQTIIPGAALDEAINSRDVSALLAPCDADPSSCGVARITLDRDADRDIYEGYADNMSEDCAAHPEQMVTRTVWSAERINEARQTIIQWECHRLYGKDCGDVTESTPLRAGYMAVPSDPGANLTTDVRWWKEMGRYTPIWAATGAYETCWGDPADSTTEVSDIVGGDCADGNDGSNRYVPEGPDDLVAIYEGTVVDCATCMDGIDNNCDSLADCDDPSCAVCFVGSGGGCAASGSPCEPSACSASPESASASALAMLGLLVIAGGRRRSRG